MHRAMPGRRNSCLANDLFVAPLEHFAARIDREETTILERREPYDALGTVGRPGAADGASRLVSRRSPEPPDRTPALVALPRDHLALEPSEHPTGTCTRSRDLCAGGWNAASGHSLCKAVNSQYILARRSSRERAQAR